LIEELLMAAEYILSHGNRRVMLCERGVRTFETTTRNTTDIQRHSRVEKPDPHSRDSGPTTAPVMPTWSRRWRARALPSGADGLIIEVHPIPKEALSDGGQSLTPEKSPFGQTGQRDRPGKWDGNKMSDEGPAFLRIITWLSSVGGLMGWFACHGAERPLPSVTGIDPDAAAVESGAAQEIVAQANVRVGSRLADVDIVILAAPVITIIQLLEKLPTFVPGKCLVLDLGSTKRRICSAMEKLPARFDALGGHPMCGKETGGLDGADASLFEDAAFVFVPIERTTPEARKTAVELTNLLGSARCLEDAETHDLLVAATSHLPYLAANALAFCTPVSAAPLAASGFASATRLAVTPPSMMMDVLDTNRDVILQSLRVYREHLHKWKICYSPAIFPNCSFVWLPERKTGPVLNHLEKANHYEFIHSSRTPPIRDRFTPR
jgi:prephenate dehydrogenase